MNDEQLTADIRRAFGRYRVDPQPIEAAEAAAGTYPLLSRRRALGGLSLAGVGLAAVLALTFAFGLGPAGQPPSVWAAWQPTPSKPDSQMRDVAREECGSHWPAGQPIPGSSVGLEQLPMLVQDQRGAIALFIFGSATDGTTVADCLLWHGPNGWTVLGIGSMAWPADFPRTDLDLMGTGSYDVSAPLVRAGDATHVSEVFGRTAGSRVVVNRADGVRVEATVQDGLFVAWWPSGIQTASLAAYNEGGAQIATESINPKPTPCICRINEPTAPSGK
jgi:hypothetical protein